MSTSLGVISIWGHFGNKIKVLAINGAGAAADEMSRLPHILAPDYDGLVAFLPGDRRPALSQVSIPAFAQAFDEVVRRLGPTVVMGHSAGGLVALAMRSPLIRAVVAIDPPLLTSKMWPVIPTLRAGLAASYDPFLDKVFGLTAAGVEERDYRPLLAGLHRPTDVVVGSDPLFPERALSRKPSFVDEPERALFAAHPLVRLHVAPNSGHQVQFEAAHFLFSVLLEACRKAPHAQAGAI